MVLSIIIVNWNSCALLRQCLTSIRRHRPAFPYEVVVVDSGSFDGSGGMLSQEFPAARFIQSGTNLGFAAANNRGAREAHGQFLLFLNPDTEVVSKALDMLAQALEQHPEAGLVGACLLNTDGSLQTSCIQSFPTISNQVLDSKWLRGIFPRSPLWGMRALFEKNSSPSPVAVISGACIMIRRSLFQELSGFDERFFMYSEDLDLCYRVGQRGYKCLHVPEAIVVHHGGGSSGAAGSLFPVVAMRQSVYRLLQIHRGRLVAAGYRMALGFSALVRLPLVIGLILVRRITGRSAQAGSFRKWVVILRWSLGLMPRPEPRANVLEPNRAAGRPSARGLRTAPTPE